ncbi:MAG: TerC family protein [Candidatus Woesearchaeota archaeon]|nr:TerC family protein [Candidatus Woesearchaeota archaeon]
MITIPGVDPWMMWAGFILLVLIMLVIDLGVFNRKDHVIGLRESLTWTAIWITVAMCFNTWLYFQFGGQIALEFFTGYVIEKSLSMDNLFVFLMIFTSFNIPRLYQHRILFWGIVGAIIMRGLFIWIGSELVSRFDWIFFIFGGILIWSAWRMQFEKEKKFDPKKHLAVRIAKKIFPVTNKKKGHNFFIVEHGKRFATVFFVALITIELTDVVFAVDSIPAIFAITQDPFIVFTSNIFAILGLRALYFALASLHAMFAYLKTGLAIILGFVGSKMILLAGLHIHVPTIVSLTVIISVLAISMIASVIHARHIPSEHMLKHDDGHVRVHLTKKKAKEYPKRKK